MVYIKPSEIKSVKKQQRNFFLTVKRSLLLTSLEYERSSLNSFHLSGEYSSPIAVLNGSQITYEMINIYKEVMAKWHFT